MKLRIFNIFSLRALRALREEHSIFQDGFSAIAVSLVMLLCTAGNIHAGPLSIDNLNRFYDNVHTYTAQFQQVVLDEGLNPVEESSGTMQIARPGRFRWDYEPPNEQRIVSNGDKVWVYDIELEQITIRSLEKSLGKTPATLLAGGGDFSSNYDVRDLGQSGVLTWVGMKPKDPESGYSDMRIGFENNELRIMELVDGLGQTTRITLTNARENLPINESRFVLLPPQGVDVIDETTQ